MQPLCSQSKKAARSSSLQSHFHLSNKTKYAPCSSLGTRGDRILKALKVFFKGCVHIQSCKVCKHPTSRMHEIYRLRRRGVPVHRPWPVSKSQIRENRLQGSCILSGKTNMHVLKDIQSSRVLTTKVCLTLKEKADSLKQFTGGLASKRMFSKLFKFEAHYCTYQLYTEAASSNYLASMQPWLSTRSKGCNKTVSVGRKFRNKNVIYLLLLQDIIVANI